MKLGKIKRINDLRSVWQHEAKDFSKWLAQEKNLLQLIPEELELLEVLEEIEGVLKFHTINNVKPTCICGTGLISLIAYLRKNEIINELGRFEDGSKRYNLTENIYISNKDIQNFLLAKAAMQTALEVMISKYPDVKHVYISGGFGNKLDLDDLVTLNIISKEIKEKVIIKKNTALEGTYKLLMTQDFDALHQMIENIESIDLSTYEDFEDMLVDSLFI